MRAPTIAVLLAMLPLAGCGHDDEGWPGCHGNHCVPALNGQCRVLDADLLCRLYDNFGTEVTGEARWTVSGPAVVATAGYIRTMGYGEIAVSAEHAPTYGMTRLLGRYLADPPRAPRPFGTTYGDAVDSGTKQALEGVRVTILDGYNAGRHGLTGTRGGFTIEPVLTEETFTWQAEKAGYEPAAGRFRIRDSSVPLEPGAPVPPWRIAVEVTRRTP
jgi:hypothetical protein